MPPHRVVNVDYEEVHQETWLIQLLARLDKPKFQLDASLVKELKGLASYHNQAYVDGQPRLPIVRTKADMLALQEQNALCLSHRDRVTDILVSYTEIQYGLDELWQKAAAKLTDTNTFRKLGNEIVRKAFPVVILAPIHEKRMHVKKVIAMCEILREHLSHTHFTIRQQLDMGVAYLTHHSA